MSVEFRIGGRVVCINGDFNIDADERAAGIVVPVEGCVYTIREIDPPNEVDDFPSLYLEEIVNPECPQFYKTTGGQRPEPSWSLYHFRPVRETSIDCFTALLAKPPVRLREDA